MLLTRQSLFDFVFSESRSPSLNLKTFSQSCNVSFIGGQPFSDQAGSRDGFGKALELMNLGPAGNDEISVVTPAAKRPKHATLVTEAVNATPPPVVGPQTVSKLG